MSKTSYNQLQTHLRHCTVFWHKWPVHDLVLVIPPPSLIKVASNRRPYSKLGGTTLNGREERGQYYISHTRQQERFAARKVVFSWECLNIFATGCSSCAYSKFYSPMSEISILTTPDQQLPTNFVSCLLVLNNWRIHFPGDLHWRAAIECVTTKYWKVCQWKLIKETNAWNAFLY